MTAENSETAPKPSIEELRAEIKQTRADLGETVQALAAKADVKARAKDQVELAKQRVLGAASDAQAKVKVAATDAQARARTSQVPFTLVFAGVAAAVGLILVLRGRKSA